MQLPDAFPATAADARCSEVELKDPTVLLRVQQRGLQADQRCYEALTAAFVALSSRSNTS